MSLEDVEQIMDDTADAVEYQRQISDLLSGSLTDEDEADVSYCLLRCDSQNAILLRVIYLIDEAWNFTSRTCGKFEQHSVHCQNEWYIS